MKEDELELLLKEFLLYFEKTFIHISYNENENLLSRYNTTFWSVYDLVESSLPRTTNSLESLHRTLNLESNVAHVKICKFIDILNNIQERTRFSLLRANKGDFDFIDANYKKEYFLLQTIKNFKNLTPESYFNLLEKVYNWDFLFNS